MVSPSVSSPARHSVNFHTELWEYVWKSASAYSTQGPSSFHAVQTLSLPNYSPLLCSLAYMLSHLSHVWFFATLWTVDCQTPQSMGFSRQDYWSGLPCPPPGDLFALIYLIPNLARITVLEFPMQNKVLPQHFPPKPLKPVGWDNDLISVSLFLSSLSISNPLVLSGWCNHLLKNFITNWMCSLTY